MLDSLKQKKNFKRIKMRIKTGDLVKVINGKEKGKTGEVLKTIPQENRVLVKGINLRTKHWIWCYVYIYAFKSSKDWRYYPWNFKS